jgi:lipopolysaccharide O-acetyltransferase
VSKIFSVFFTRIVCSLPFALKSRGKSSWILRPRRIRGIKFIGIGNNTQILKGSWIEAIDSYAGEKFTPNITIGNNVYIGQNACITCIDSVKIGDGCVLSEQVYISDSSHGYDPNGGLIMKQKLSSKGPVTIDNDTFIGYRAVITPGVHLGQRCIVGANSVVTKSFPEFSMVAGVPAKLIKRYCIETKQWV